MPRNDPVLDKEYRRQYYLAHKDRAKAAGRTRYLKNHEKRKEQSRKWYADHRERALESRKRRYAANRIETDRRNKVWQDAHPAEVRRIKQKYRLSHKKEIAAYNIQYHVINKKRYDEYRKQWRRDNPDKLRNEKLKARFGITIQDFDALLVKQKGRCGICGEMFCDAIPEFRNNPLYPCVDHNHDGGNIRGILCRRCNSGIGGFNDDVNLLIKAIGWMKDGGRKCTDIQTMSITDSFKRENRSFGYMIKRVYNLTLSQYSFLLHEQHYFCGICGNPLARSTGRGRGNGSINIDHCHKTGFIRGLLCSKCNKALGLLKDNLNVLENAISWLRKGHQNENN